MSASGGAIASPAGRYLQYRATLTSSTTASPRLDSVSYSTLSDTPTPTATRTSTPTSTSTATPTATATFTPTATPIAVTTARTDTTTSDFSLAPVPAGLIVADQAGGEVRRAAGLEDYFDAPLSASLWSWGTFDGSTYNPAPTGGSLAVQTAARPGSARPPASPARPSRVG